MQWLKRALDQFSIDSVLNQGDHLVLPAILRSILTWAPAEGQAAQMVPPTWHIEARHPFGSPLVAIARKPTLFPTTACSGFWSVLCIVCRMFSMKWRVNKFLVGNCPPTTALVISFAWSFCCILCLKTFKVQPYHALI